MSRVIHRGDDSEGVFASHPTAQRFTKATTRLAKSEQSAIGKAILARYSEGQKVVDTRTGDIAVVDSSMPLGLRPLWKATNRHAHGGSFVLGKDDLSKSACGEAYDGPAYGHLAGSEAEVNKRRDNRPANPNSRL